MGKQSSLARHRVLLQDMAFMLGGSLAIGGLSEACSARVWGPNVAGRTGVLGQDPRVFL